MIITAMIRAPYGNKWMYGQMNDHDNQNNVHPIRTPQSTASNGGGHDDRLRYVEIEIAKIQTKLESTSTKEDIRGVETTIAKTETRIIRWLIGVIVSAALALVLALIKTFTA